MDLTAFGQRLRHLRKMTGLTQPALAQQVGVTPQLISVWERAYQHQGRYWKPDRQMTLGLLEVFAERLTPGEALHWAGLAGHNLNPVELQSIFPTYWAQAPAQLPPLTPFYIERPHLQETILDRLETASSLALVGPGGTGKTSLAAWATRFLAERFSDGVIWVDNLASNDVETAQRWIARSFEVTLNGSTPAERAAELRTLLCDKQCLLVLDDIWAGPDLVHLQVVNPHSYLLLTSRDLKVADMLNIPFLWVGGLTAEEGSALLAAWVGHSLEAEELVSRLGGLPLALSLSGAQLRAGNLTLDSLLAHFRQAQVDLSLLDLDEAQNRTESLNICFDLSYGRLRTKDQQHLAQLGCFAGSFEETTVTAIWGVKSKEAYGVLRRLRRLAWLKQDEHGYHLHPLLQDYARQQLATWPELAAQTYRRYVAWYIRFALYHPAMLDNITEPTSRLDDAWADIVEGVRWAVTHDPQLAAWAALLAHTERPVLLETIGSPLIDAIVVYQSQLSTPYEKAIWAELLGDLYLLKSDFELALPYFEKAVALYQESADWLAASQARLRVAGIYLLQQSEALAAMNARQAQALLAQATPIASFHLEAARRLFYWFDMIYGPLSHSPELPQADLLNLLNITDYTNQPILKARAVDIYRLWCLVQEIPRPEHIRELGRQLALEAYWLWRANGQKNHADTALTWSIFRLKGCFSQRAAARMARRRSNTTPQISQMQAKLVQRISWRWWLCASEQQRVAWFSRMLPRYLGAINCVGQPLPKGSRAWEWVEDILNLGMLGNEGRRVTVGSQPPHGQLLEGPEWRILTGQKVFPLVTQTALRLTANYLHTLETLCLS